MHPKDILEAIGVLHRAQCETKSSGADQMVIKGVDIGPSSRYYGVRTIRINLIVGVGKSYIKSKINNDMKYLTVPPTSNTCNLSIYFILLTVTRKLHLEKKSSV